jgi:hypothetical protein
MHRFRCPVLPGEEIHLEQILLDLAALLKKDSDKEVIFISCMKPALFTFHCLFFSKAGSPLDPLACVKGGVDRFPGSPLCSPGSRAGWGSCSGPGFLSRGSFARQGPGCYRVGLNTFLPGEEYV